MLSKHFGDKYLLRSLIQQMFIEVFLFTKHCSTDPPGIEQGTWWKTHTHTHTKKLPSLLSILILRVDFNCSSLTSESMLMDILSALSFPYCHFDL